MTTTTAKHDHNIYSDLFKDVYGYRPRGSTWDRFQGLSSEDKDREMDDLCEELERELNREREERLAFAEKVRSLGLDPSKYLHLLDPWA